MKFVKTIKHSWKSRKVSPEFAKDISHIYKSDFEFDKCIDQKLSDALYIRFGIVAPIEECGDEIEVVCVEADIKTLETYDLVHSTEFSFYIAQKRS